MEFKPGDTLGYYRIFVTESTQASSSQITVSLLGSNADIYTISKSTLQFKLFAHDTVLPDVTSIAITQIFRATASVVITTNKVSIVYYAVAGYGTIPPSFKELEQGGPPSYNTNEIQYGVAYINTSLVVNVTISNLSAQKSYTIFAIAADQMLQTSLLVRIANFTTLPRYSPAIISLWFTQTYLTSVETSIAINAVALVIGYNPWQVQEVSTASRRLSSATDNVVTLLQLYLIDNPSSDFYPRPVQLIDMLQAQISYLNESLNNFNSSAGIVGQEVVLSECSYYSAPMLLGTTNYQSISLEAALVEGGYLYGVAVPSNNDTGIPLPYQVAAGLDAANRLANSDWQMVKLKTYGNLTFGDLVSGTDYNVYVVCGNLVPAYPSLSSTVTVIQWKTDLSPAADLLKLSASLLIGYSLLLFSFY